MVDHIRYSDRDGRETSTSSWVTTLEDARDFARGGLARHRAASARVFHAACEDNEVWRSDDDTACSPRGPA